MPESEPVVTDLHLLSPREKALIVDDILIEEYGAPFIPSVYRDPLSELVKSLLSHRTRNAVSRAAYDKLRATFPTWEAVIDAPTDEVEAAIAVVTFPEVKAPRVQAILSTVRELNDGELSLEGLHEVGMVEARTWLENIKGIGAKTSAAVLSFSNLRMPALVVDTHHYRVALRLGLVPPKSSLDKTARILQDYLPEDWDGQRVYDSHQGFMRHGQRVCTYRKPNCAACLIHKYCNFYVNGEGE